MPRPIIFLITFFSGGICYHYNIPSSSKELAYLFWGISLTEFFSWLHENGKYVWIYFQCFIKDKIRISFAYLIRIRIDDQYLLVRSSKIKDQFQPPGGVFQYYDFDILDKFGLAKDIGFKDSPKNDLRKIMASPRKNLPPFLIWFFNKKEREVSPHREFYEELIEESILNADLFKTPSFKYIGTQIKALKYSEHFDVHEFMLFEIYELIMNKEQYDMIESLTAAKSDKFKFLDISQINRHGFNEDSNEVVRIGSQTKYIL